MTCPHGNAGRVRGVLMPKGAVSVHRNGRRSRPYAVVKLGTEPRNRVRLARYVYERMIGPIPSGWVIYHRNGDPLDCRAENLEAISRAESARRIALKATAEQLRRWNRKRGDVGRRTIRAAQARIVELRLQQRIQKARQEKVAQVGLVRRVGPV